jgi:predicted O-methyltransferase YrrM
VKDRLELFGILKPGAIAIEVGTFAGEFALLIKKTFPYINLAVVDDWKPPFDKARGTAYATLTGFANILDMSSKEAAESLPDGVADLIYIDGAHDKASVEEDIRVWWPKLKSGGRFCGHDYMMRPAPEGAASFWGPIETPLAVDPWAKELGLTIGLTQDDPPSWWVTKP